MHAAHGTLFRVISSGADGGKAPPLLALGKSLGHLTSLSGSTSHISTPAQVSMGNGEASPNHSKADNCNVC